MRGGGVEAVETGFGACIGALGEPWSRGPGDLFPRSVRARCGQKSLSIRDSATVT
jgi:hypothetical protein